MTPRKFYVLTSEDAHDARNWWLYAQDWFLKSINRYELSEKDDLPDYWFIKNYFLQVYGPGYIFLDVGANIGLSALGLAKAGVDVIAFEPVEENIRLLERSIVENSVIHKLHLVPFALGNDRGTKTIYVPVNADNSSLNSEIAVINMREKACEPQEVMITTLDDFLGLGNPKLRPKKPQPGVDVARIRMIKIDVQGYELDVLMGAQRFLEACPRSTSVLLELDPKILRPRNVRPEQIIGLMQRWGFTAHDSISSLDKMFIKE